MGIEFSRIIKNEPANAEKKEKRIIISVRVYSNDPV
jgi:hypothetical protein